ncbi:hypothetical protein TI39_contig4309g00017 [Zymoseptoria brevis]|uniref:Exonuclease domain-containing protein n=1 Tax=Zymoseptoria brevis TaxID=1047168 RepID=A0A0F4G827_9PEZI|nr:hypothetical protein TI39_contig4309g00017 [Zymoseptoria brevis]
MVPYPHKPKVTLAFPSHIKGCGVDFHNIKPENGAVDNEVAEKMFAEIMKDLPVIMHAAKGDMAAFQHLDPFKGASEVVDTQQMYSSGRGHNPGLQTCAAAYLGRSIQQDGHTPVEDATATMELYLLKKPYDRAAKKAKLISEGKNTISGPVFHSSEW